MKSKTFLFLLTFSIPFCLFSQGTNNDFEYDKTDLESITSELGFYTFKFPVEQNSQQIYDIVIEEFENGQMINKISLVKDTKEKFKKYGIEASNYLVPKKDSDSIYFHRFYFHKKDSLISLKIKSHGIGSKHDFSLTGKSTFDMSAIYSAKEEIDSLGFIKIEHTKPLMFLYANSEKEKEEPLWCPSGIEKEDLVKRFYYVILISMKEFIKD
ncbi:hypothetical protein EYD45_14330 [Hyunsoonleella flava]|uniref:Uncharacterized protein n=1 Tax=Hyunsoonleella flava TaxID=2527939 RepID=A0A4Q9FDZ2_9FLAO|nr:hypothetical protein [Hyunsoonleella flava]TBN00441.1 hypothetical protein EYD45_14330 [Hyunsoonleella flava]